VTERPFCENFERARTLQRMPEPCAECGWPRRACKIMWPCLHAKDEIKARTYTIDGLWFWSWPGRYFSEPPLGY
jgi:hypothetical protein